MDHLMHAAKELVKLMDKAADKSLPQEISNVVKLHSKIAVGSALIPVPGADMAASAANIWTMYGRLNKKIGVPIGENVLKSIGAGVATNLTSYVALSGVASAMKFIPGIGTLGGAVIMGASLYGLTLVSGWVYIKALCLMVERNGYNFNITDLKKAINDVLSNKSLIKEMFTAAKKDYRA